MICSVRSKKINETTYATLGGTINLNKKTQVERQSCMLGKKKEKTEDEDEDGEGKVCLQGRIHSLLSFCPSFSLHLTCNAFSFTVISDLGHYSVQLIHLCVRQSFDQIFGSNSRGPLTNITKQQEDRVAPQLLFRVSIFCLHLHFHLPKNTGRSCWRTEKLITKTPAQREIIFSNLYMHFKVALVQHSFHTLLRPVVFLQFFFVSHLSLC